MTSKSVVGIEKRAEIRAKVKELLGLGPSELTTLEVLFSRDQPSSRAMGFINVYFLAGDVTQEHNNRGDDGRLVVRIGYRSSGDVDSELDDLAKLVVQQLGEPVNRLDGVVDEFTETRWEYGAPEGSSVSFLALIYNVQY